MLLFLFSEALLCLPKKSRQEVLPQKAAASASLPSNNI
jgi:hypothetical protein